MPEPGPYPTIKTPWNSAPSVTVPENEQPPIPIPDHTLVRRIGKGSYGEVWLARSTLGVGRAVKIVHRRAFDDDRPFERELAGIQRFEPISRTHESQLNILHVGRGPDCFYYVMELADDARYSVSGEPSNAEAGLKTERCVLNIDTYTPRTLRSELLFRGRLPMDECLRLGLALTTALEHLHRHGLVHRDIKPSNIVFVNGIPKLADIGLVARAEAAPSFVGTEGYLPPEGPGTRQADLFSLGKVLYELSTGRDRQQFPELPTNVTQLPDRAALSEFNEVLLRACAPDARQRYQSAAEMHADLALLQSGKSVARLRANERRLKFAARAAALITALAVLAGAAFLYQQAQTRKARELGSRNRQLAEEEASLAIEKTKLAENLTKLGEENRNRIARLDIANGARLLDEGDATGALLWFADALPLVTNKPTEESIHRIRIQQTLNQIPRLLQVLPHENVVTACAFSQDGRRIVTGTEWGRLCVWDAHSGTALWPPLALDVDFINQARFTRDGKRVFASSLPEHGFVDYNKNPTKLATIIEAETGQPLFSLSGTNLIRADLSPDDRWLVTADSDNVIRVHDARDGRPITELKGHTDRILMFSFSTNGNVLASCSQDGTVRLWRLPSGELIGSPIEFDHELGLIVIALSQDGKILVTSPWKSIGATNSIIQTWAVQTRASVGTAIEMKGRISELSFVSRAGQALFVATDKECRLFDPESHEPLLQPIKFPPGTSAFSVSPDGRHVAFCGDKGFAGVWSLETGELLLPPCLWDRPAGDMEFSPDGSQLAINDGETVTLLNSHLPREDASYHFDGPIEKRGPVPLLEWHRFSPDRRRFLLILLDRTVRLVDFDRMTDQRITAAQFNGLTPWQCTFDTSGHRGAIYYSGADTNVVEIWTEDGRTTNRFVLSHPAGLRNQFLFTRDGSRLITAGTDGLIRVWKTVDGTLERSIPVGELDPNLILFPDGRSAFGISKGRGGLLFDYASGSVTEAHMPPFEITAFRFDSMGERFASAGVVNWSRVWSARACEPLTPPLQHGGEVRLVDWSPDGTRLTTAGLTPDVKVWDATTGDQVLAPLRLGASPIEAALWSLDGRFIVARSDDNLARAWDAATGEPVTPLLKHDSYIRLAHLVSNNRLITLSMPNLMRAWDLVETRLSIDVIVDYARLVSGRQFNTVGVMVPLKAAELGELSRSLRKRAPQLFE